jgi:hypothetical protein
MFLSIKKSNLSSIFLMFRCRVKLIQYYTVDDFQQTIFHLILWNFNTCISSEIACNKLPFSKKKKLLLFLND